MSISIWLVFTIRWTFTADADRWNAPVTPAIGCPSPSVMSNCPVSTNSICRSRTPYATTMWQRSSSTSCSTTWCPSCWAVPTTLPSLRQILTSTQNGSKVRPIWPLTYTCWMVMTISTRNSSSGNRSMSSNPAFRKCHGMPSAISAPNCTNPKRQSFTAPCCRNGRLLYNATIQNFKDFHMLFSSLKIFNKIAQWNHIYFVFHKIILIGA